MIKAVLTFHTHLTNNQLGSNVPSWLSVFKRLAYTACRNHFEEQNDGDSLVNFLCFFALIRRQC